MSATASVLSLPDGALPRRLRVTPIRLFGRVLLSCGCVLALLWNTILLHVLVTRWNMNDFGKFYYATTGWLAGRDLYAPNIASTIPLEGLGGLQLLDMNPPHFHLLMLPLAVLPPELALNLWIAVSLFAALLSVVVISRELSLVWTPERVLGALFCALLFSGTQTFFGTAQLSLLLMLPMTLCWADARRGRWTRAGLWLGACASIKPFLLIFVPYLVLTRRPRALAVMMITFAGAFSVGVLIFGVPMHTSWLRALAASNQWTWFPICVSVNGLFARLFTSTASYAPIVIAPALMKLWVLPVVAIGVASFVPLLMRRDDESVDASFAALLLASQLISPLGWVYYLWWPVGPLAALARGRNLSPWPTRAAVTAGVALLLPHAITQIFQPSGWATLLSGSVYFWATVTLWMVSVGSSWPSAAVVCPKNTETS